MRPSWGSIRYTISKPHGLPNFQAILCLGGSVQISTSVMFLPRWDLSLYSSAERQIRGSLSFVSTVWNLETHPFVVTENIEKGGAWLDHLHPPPLVSPFAYFTSPWFKYHILAMKCKLNKPWVTILSVWLAGCRLPVPFPWLVVFHIGRR